MEYELEERLKSIRKLMDVITNNDKSWNNFSSYNEELNILTNNYQLLTNQLIYYKTSKKSNNITGKCYNLCDFVNNEICLYVYKDYTVYTSQQKYINMNCWDIAQRDPIDIISMKIIL